MINNRLTSWLWLLAVLVLPMSAGASPPSQSGLIGLLEVPHQWDQSSEDYRVDSSLAVYADANINSADQRVIHNLSDLETFEWSYEAPAAAVFGYHHDGEQAWYQLGLESTGARGWVVASKQLNFHPLSELVSESLAYLTGSWDKRVFSDVADPATAKLLDVTGDEIPIEVAGTAMFEGQLWVLVVVMKQSQCWSSAAPQVLDVGWLPAHSASGQLNIWYYSRGC
ncbi:MAG: hypothetical protein JKY89_00545 [Immundisolibacteraceae bacterium]|nr:hypothetical protein [Immundisolibacteraceae bacterium]